MANCPGTEPCLAPEDSGDPAVTSPASWDVLGVLDDRYGRTFAAEAGIRIARNTPAPLFQLLCLTMLASAPIGADLAMSGFHGLSDDGLTTTRKMRAASWERRTRVLNRAGYARYDESTSRYLADTAQLVEERYDGDLRALRDAADHDRSGEHRLLTEFKGIGEVGADMFLREVQQVWPEVGPFLDDRASRCADELGLTTDADQLRAFADDGAHFTRMVAALVRCDLDGGSEAVLAAAGSSG